MAAETATAHAKRVNRYYNLMPAQRRHKSVNVIGNEMLTDVTRMKSCPMLLTLNEQAGARFCAATSTVIAKNIKPSKFPPRLIGEESHGFWRCFESPWLYILAFTRPCDHQKTVMHM